uniref:urokinase plasminogen activator surface receptor-like isoform X2 n=1 Tax=Pristiophorus japonicus TaxID=55135 RepID=UPI00398E5A55
MAIGRTQLGNLEIGDSGFWCSILYIYWVTDRHRHHSSEEKRFVSLICGRSPKFNAKMKFFSGIFIICALVTEASALECFRCVDPTGNCTQKEICSPTLNHTCSTILITQTVGTTNSSLFVKRCGTCTEPSSFNNGYLMRSVEFSCCSSDLCNDQHHEVKENTTLNARECFGCFNNSTEACASSMSILKCVGNQNRCYHDSSTQGRGGALIVQKGCVSENICQSPKLSIFGVQTTSDTFCCKGNLCNNETTLPGLQCHSCISATGECQSKPIQCASLSCRSLHIKQTVGGTSYDFLVNDSGNCTGTQSINVGAVSLHMADRCCQSDLCNNQTNTANTTLNGLECYGCVTTLNQTCEDPKETVKCVGEQDSCLHGSGTNDLATNITIKGCASRSICDNPDLLQLYSINRKQEFYCCKNSGCNRGRERSEVSTAQTTKATDTVAVTKVSTAQTTKATDTVAVTSDSPAVEHDLPLFILPLIVLIPCLF